MAAIETSFSIFCSYPSTSPKFQFHPKTLHPLKLHNSTSTLKLFLKTPLYSLPFPSTKKSTFKVHSTAEAIEIQEEAQKETPKKTQLSNPKNAKRKLFVLNLPWSYSVTDIQTYFTECGTVSDVEIIKHKDGKNRGFAFVTMATGEGAQAAVDKFDSAELLGRIIRVEYAKKFKKPKPPSSPTTPPPPPRETRHKLYISNLGWKVRSSSLREFFSVDFKPVSARVVFDSASGKSAGYGFVSFVTKEEAESALSALNGKELLGREIQLKFSEKSEKIVGEVSQIREKSVGEVVESISEVKVEEEKEER